jgi:mannose/fructose-specific phosphotransferase system component IIA
MKILLASHGKLAEGMKNTLEIIMGEQKQISTISAYLDDIPFDTKLDEYMKTVDFDNDTLIIVSDVFGGSVNQKVLGKVDMSKVKLISGMNLPLLLELVMLNESNITDEKLTNIVSSSKEMIMFVNPVVEKKFEDDFDL